MLDCGETAFEQGRSEEIKNDGLPEPRFLERGWDYSTAARLRAETERLEKERAAREGKEGRCRPQTRNAIRRTWKA